MKTSNFLIAAAAVSALTFQGCTDDFNNKTPLPEGTEIQFGAALSDVDGTRTYYGPEETVNGLRVWPIYWNYEAGKLDEIFIYSPEAAAGRNQARYQVNPGAANKKEASNIKRLGDVGIQTSDKDTYNFYALYPAKYVTGQATGTTISGTLPGQQSCTYIGYTAGADITKNSVLPAAAAGNRTYIMSPNMDYCLMTGKHTNVQVSDEPVSVQFSPFSSVIDITVNGPIENNVQDGQTTARVTSIEVTADAPITGDFNIEFDNEGNPVFSAGANASNVLTIPVLASDGEDEIGIPLMYENKLNVKAFILPNPNVKDLKVKVYTSDSKFWTKTLNMNGFKSKQIHPVKLPLINLEEGQFDYSVWLSQLDPRIYITELSLPGSCLSFNTTANGMSGNTVTQTLDIAGQFDKGVRVFQAHCWPVSAASTIDGKPRLNLTTSDGRDTGIGLLEVVNKLKTEMAANHGNEFCVLMLSDYKINGSRYDFADFYERFRALTDAMAAEGLLADNVTPNTTIADVKGKIILKLQTNATVDGSGNSGVNNTLSKIQSWSALNGSKALFNWFTETAQTRLFYAPLQFGGVGSFQFTPGSTTWSSYTRPVITSSTAGIALEAANKLINTTTTTTTPIIGKVNVTAGSANCTTKPSTLDNATTMWYMYSEQANPSTSQVQTNVRNVVSSISDTYQSTDSHNKFYMTYCGGTGGSSITDAGNTAWKGAIANVSKKPYGWVLFNDIPATFVSTPDANSTQACITTVIGNNNDNNFKLRRNRSQSAQSSPNGDAQPVRPGGSLF